MSDEYEFIVSKKDLDFFLNWLNDLYTDDKIDKAKYFDLMDTITDIKNGMKVKVVLQ